MKRRIKGATKWDDRRVKREIPKKEGENERTSKG